MKKTFDFQGWMKTEAEACDTAKEWFAKYPTAKDGWEACDNPSWMFHAVRHAPKEWKVSLKSIRLCALEIASLCSCDDKYYPAGWTHKKVLAVIKKYLTDPTSKNKDALQNAANAAHVAYASAQAANAAAHAASASAQAAYAAYASAQAAYASAQAAHAASAAAQAASAAAHAASAAAQAASAAAHAANAASHAATRIFLNASNAAAHAANAAANAAHAANAAAHAAAHAALAANAAYAAYAAENKKICSIIRKHIKLPKWMG